MDINAQFPSKWLKASDLQNRTHRLTIQDVTLEQFQDGSSKPAVWFQGREKAMILNKTNAESIAAAYGNDTDGWLGKALEIFSMKVQGPNGIVDGIRVRIPDAPPTQPPPAGTTEADLNDDIPF